MTGSTEADVKDVDWQARAQQRRRRMYTIIGGLFGAGLISGLLVGYFEDEKRGLLAGNSIPPEIAIFSAVMFAIAVTFGTWRYIRAADELERRINAASTVMAGNVLLLGFPIWFLLWKGGLVPEPDAVWLFCAGFLASLLTYGWQKFR